MQISKNISGTPYTINNFGSLYDGAILAKAGGAYIYVDFENPYCNKVGQTPGSCPGTTRTVYLRYPENWKFTPSGTLTRDVAAEYDSQSDPLGNPYHFYGGVGTEQGVMSGNS
jgi:hypothetical protein